MGSEMCIRDRFVIIMAAAEAAVALAIIINVFNNLDTVNIDDARELKL